MYSWIEWMRRICSTLGWPKKYEKLLHVHLLAVRGKKRTKKTINGPGVANISTETTSMATTSKRDENCPTFYQTSLVPIHFIEIILNN